MSNHDEREIYDQEVYEHPSEVTEPEPDADALTIRSVEGAAPSDAADGGDELGPPPLLQSRIVQMTLALSALLVVVALVAGGVYWYMRSSRDKPLELDTYPGAQLVNDEVIRPGHDHQQYIATDPIEQIETFYDDQDGVTCQRQYGEVREDPETGELIREQHLFTVCDIDRSWLDMTQYTTVTIQPTYDDADQPTDHIVIDVQRRWGN